MKYFQETFDEERALYGVEDAEIIECKFDGPADGESAMKECERLYVDKCYFNLRYPFWHVKGAVIDHSEMTENCRAALWYDTDVKISHTKLYGIKALRECSAITLQNCDVNSPEFLWRCKKISIDTTDITSEYPFFECSNLAINKLNMKGKYSFQYVENAVIQNANLDTKDAFWHSKNVTVTDSVIKGEYLAWYSENLKLVRCKIIGTQPLCYCKGLILEDCTMEQTDLSFENSEVHATIKGTIESVKNPAKGEIHADAIGDIIWDSKKVEPCNTKILLG